MDYIFCTAALLVGIFLHIMQKINKLRNKFPQLNFKTIWSTFFQEEWDSLMVSFVIIIAYNLFLYIAFFNQIKFLPWFDKWGMYALALVLGYGGQRIAYKYLTTVEEKLIKDADKLKSP